MARISINDVDNYVSNGSGEFFSLSNDGDTAMVHFLVENEDDLDLYVVHKVKDEVTGKYRYVSCIRMAGDPVDACPLCEAGLKREVRLFLQMLDLDDGKLKIWDRGRSFIKTIQGHATRIKPLFKRCIEVERNGKKGDLKTTYNLYPIEDPENYPDLEKEDLPEKADIMGTIVLDKDADELIEFLNTGTFTDDSEQQEQPQVRTRGAGVGGVSVRGGRQATTQPTGRASARTPRQRNY